MCRDRRYNCKRYLWKCREHTGSVLNNNETADSDALDYGALVGYILTCSGLTQSELAQFLGTSFLSVARWRRGDTRPSVRMRAKLVESRDQLNRRQRLDVDHALTTHVFASRGVRHRSSDLLLLRTEGVIELNAAPKAPIVERLRRADLWSDASETLPLILAKHRTGTSATADPATDGVSAGKNTYTYDAHTYHTKVPPQGIAEVIRQYLPEGGLVFDPFAGSGMTGVAAMVLGLDVILNELSPAASFIADRFTHSFDPHSFAAGVRTICESLADFRRRLYTTRCRECGRKTEVLFTVWSYRVLCSTCGHEFLLWDQCRSYGKTVREHKILREFPCPRCAVQLKKSRLQRTTAHPIFLGYKCCSRQQVERSLTEKDRAHLMDLKRQPPVADGFVPTTELPDGVNLCQPKRHGLTSVDRFYTPRNLAAMSALWREIHRVPDDELAGFLAFVFTSLYQRVTRLSEYRFWGGSGNTARFNVPYIFNEANVFVTFERKARTIQDHLETTARRYSGRAVVRTGSATNLDFLPDGSVDLIFTDPPFGANINYSEMNLLWESWLGCFTDNLAEAVVNRFQNKDVDQYGRLMTESLRECHRVLKRNHWMILVFMNSSEKVWRVLRTAIRDAGFSLDRVDIFDKQHGTFKQFVSENTAGCDLMLHCRRVDDSKPADVVDAVDDAVLEAVRVFLVNREKAIPTMAYLHVQRADEIDYRMLYSEFLAQRLGRNGSVVDFAVFRAAAVSCIE